MSELEFIQGFPTLNVYVWQKLDPVLYFLLGPGVLHNKNLLIGLNSGIFITGLFLAFFLTKNPKDIEDKILIKKLFRSSLLTLTASLSLYFIFTNSLFFSGLHYFPSLLAALVFIERKLPSFSFEKNAFNINSIYFAPLLISGTLWILHSGALSMTGLLISFLFGIFYLKITSSKFSFLYLFFFFLSIFTLPNLTTSPYPKGAKLVSKELFNLGEKSFFSKSLNAPFVEFTEYQNILLNIIVCFFLIIIGFTLIKLAFSKKHSLHGLNTLIFLFFLSICEFIFAKCGFSYSFFSIFSEIIPGLNQLPLFWLLLTPCLILALFNFLKNISSNFLISASALLALSFYVRNNYYQETFLNLNKNLILKNDYKNLSHQNKALYSPSNPALNSHGLWAASPRAYFERHVNNLKKLTKNETGELQILNTEHILEANFQNPVKIIKIYLAPVNGKKIIPKSILVEGLIEEDSSWQVLQEANPWLGPLRWSNNSGVFLGDKSKIIIDLPKPEKLKGIRFIQKSNNALVEHKINLYSPR